MSCPSEDTYKAKNGGCCDVCPAGKYVGTDCKGSEKTRCLDCSYGHYTATKNSMTNCLVCRQCSAQKHQRALEECTSKTNRVCACQSGFYCYSPDCEYCGRATMCPPGEGAKIQPTRLNNTECAPCGQGTYSNTTDLHPCRPHTRCEDVGRHLKSAGTPKEDAVCGDFKTLCPWTVPVSLWSGFLLTLLLVILLFFCWRRKRRRNITAKVPVQLVVAVPAEPVFSIDTNGNSHGSYPVPTELSADDATDSLSTKLYRSTSDLEFSRLNQSQDTGCSLLPRAMSEPQEDEWCGS